MEILALIVLLAFIFMITAGQKNSVQDKENKKVDFQEIKHRKREYLTTENERRFFYALKGVLKDKYDIHCQVSLIALVEPIEFKHKKRAYSKRMDFVITDKKSKVLCVIELDDSSHNSKKRIVRDKYVNHALNGHHPFLRFMTKSYFKQSDIAKRLIDEADMQVDYENFTRN